MSELPPRLVVGPFIYQVSADAAKLRDHEHNKRGAYGGYTEHALLEIILDPTLAPGTMRETLWHEVKHAVIYLFGEYGDMNDETYVRRTAAMELAVLRQNPGLVRFLLTLDE